MPTLLQAPWLTDAAKEELAALQKKDQYAFNTLDFQQKNWLNHKTPSALWLNNVASHGCVETFKAAVQHLGVGVNGENTYHHHSLRNSVDEQTPLMAALSGSTSKQKSGTTMALWLLDNGADMHRLCTDIMSGLDGGNTPWASSVLHASVRNSAALTLLFQRGANVDMGSIRDPNLGRYHPHSVLSSWCEWANGSDAKTCSMPALKVLHQHGYDFNEAVNGPRFPDCQQNLLCHFWSYYPFNRFLPDVLSWGVDPHQVGPDGHSLYSKVLEDSVQGKGKVKKRAVDFLGFLDQTYPLPTISIPSSSKMGP